MFPLYLVTKINRPPSSNPTQNYDKKSPAPKSKKSCCTKCNKTFFQYNGRNTTAFRICYDCYVVSRKRKSPRSKALATVDNKDDNECPPDVVSQSSCILGYDTVDVGLFKMHRPKDHSKVKICNKINGISTFVNAIADTGAQSNL